LHETYRLPLKFESFHNSLTWNRVLSLLQHLEVNLRDINQIDRLQVM
jgi:hypothetical protein